MIYLKFETVILTFGNFAMVYREAGNHFILSCTITVTGLKSNPLLLFPFSLAPQGSSAIISICLLFCSFLPWRRRRMRKWKMECGRRHSNRTQTANPMVRILFCGPVISIDRWKRRLAVEYLVFWSWVLTAHLLEILFYDWMSFMTCVRHSD